MNNLFSSFDPSTTLIFSCSLNWVASFLILMIIAPNFWVSLPKLTLFLSTIMKTLEKEIHTNLSPIPSPGVSHILVSLFSFVALNNYLGLTPYFFTSSSHLTFTMTIALVFWLGLMITSHLKDLSHSLAHLVPLGTPNMLIPLMVLIELVSNIIRPLTLSVRLAANMVAGHLLLTLISSAMNPFSSSMWILILLALGMLMILENAVALIQAYVFSMLPSLYVSEANTSKLNYLNNSVIHYLFFNKF